MRWRPFACCLMALVLASGGCSFDDVSSGPAPGAAETGPEAPPSETPLATPSPEPTSETFGRFGPPDFKAGGINATSAGRRMPVWAEPVAKARPARKIETHNSSGQRIAFLALEARRTEDGTPWVKVMIPIRPNGSTGWVRLDKGSVELSRVHDRIVVDLSSFTLKHFRQKQLLHEFHVAIGESRYPTPVGEFFAWLTFEYQNPQGAFGNYAIGLSGYSPVLSDWPGGGRAAIHGTTDLTDLGQAVSHGCVRVFNTDMAKLADVPLGTPVLIRE